VFFGVRKKQTRESKSKKKGNKKGRFRENFFKGKKVSGENLLIACVKEKLHAKRKDTNKSCARVKLLLHGTTTVTRLF
jgi:hypothetical protein